MEVSNGIVARMRVHLKWICQLGRGILKLPDPVLPANAGSAIPAEANAEYLFGLAGLRGKILKYRNIVEITSLVNIPAYDL